MSNLSKNMPKPIKKKQEQKKYQVCPVRIKSIDEDNYTLEAVFSTATEDRHGDVVMQNWDLKNFKVNPVILNSHTYYDATEVVGRAEKIKVSDGKLKGKIKFAVDENPKAKIIFALYAGGFLNAFSVGFIVKQWDDKGNILKSELLEISAVSVPANAEALVQAKAKGIDVDQLYVRSNHEENLPNEDDKQPNANGESDDSKAGGNENETEDEPAPGNNEPENKDERESEPTPKSAEQIIKETIEKVNNQKLRALQKIIAAISFVSDNIGKAESSVENKRLINQAVRKLIKLK